MTDTRCGQCKHYAPLKDPFHYEIIGYPDGVTVHGFCTKDATTRFSFYPVYLPDGGQCKEFKRVKALRDTPLDGQIKMMLDEQTKEGDTK